MPITGRKPKPAGQKRNRTKPSYEWTEFADVPFAAAPPLLGRRSRAVLEWWEAISTMPHCVIWAPSDWQFARDTARYAAALAKGDLRAGVELRQREKVMGTTADARRDLRYRYVPETEDEEEADGVTSLADYRASLAE